MKYTDEQFMSAVRDTLPQRGQIEKIAERVGCSTTTTLKRLRKLEEQGKVTISKRKTYDKQEFLPGNYYFGGAGSCIRRYLTVQEQT